MEEYREEKNNALKAVFEGHTQYEDKTAEEKKASTPSRDDYYELPEDKKSRSMLWSMLSLILSVLSVVLCAFWYVSIPFAVASIVFAIVSRRKLGYFDTMTVVGLILGIVGTMFGVASAVLDLTGVIDALMMR